MPILATTTYVGQNTVGSRGQRTILMSREVGRLGGIAAPSTSGWRGESGAAVCRRRLCESR